MDFIIANLVVVAFGCVALFRPITFAIKCFFVFTLFATTAVIELPSGATVIAASFFLLFVVIRLSLTSRPITRIIAELSPASPGFWLSIAIGYGLLAAIFLPRLMPGVTDVYAIGRFGGRLGVAATVPFGPSGSHLTQSIYAIGGLVAFLVVSALLRKLDAAKLVTESVKMVGAILVLLSVLDLVTYYAHIPDVLSPIRTAGYSILSDTSISGLKRIVAGYPEASIFVLKCINGLCVRFSSLDVQDRTPHIWALDGYSACASASFYIKHSLPGACAPCGSYFRAHGSSRSQGRANRAPGIFDDRDRCLDHHATLSDA